MVLSAWGHSIRLGSGVVGGKGLEIMGALALVVEEVQPVVTVLVIVLAGSVMVLAGTVTVTVAEQEEGQVDELIEAEIAVVVDGVVVDIVVGVVVAEDVVEEAGVVTVAKHLHTLEIFEGPHVAKAPAAVAVL